MNKGPLLALLSTIFFAVMGIFVKLVSPFAATSAIVFYRGFISFLIMVCLVVFSKERRRVRNWGIIIVRSVSGGLALSLFFKSLKMLPLGEATMLCYTYPIFSTILSFFILREPVRLREVVFMLFAVVGIVFIVNPGLNFHIEKGYLYGLMSGVFAGLAVFSLRVARKTEDSIMIVLVFMAIVSLMSLPFYLSGGPALPIRIWLLLLVVGFVGGFAQLFLTIAYKYCRVIICSTISLMTVVFSLLLSIVLLREKYAVLSLVGIFIVLISTVMLNYKNT